MEPVLYFIHTNGEIFGSTAVSVFQNFGMGKVKLILLQTFPPMSIAEQGVIQVLHMRNKYRNSLDMNNTGGNATRLS